MNNRQIQALRSLMTALAEAIDALDDTPSPRSHPAVTQFDWSLHAGLLPDYGTGLSKDTR